MLPMSSSSPNELDAVLTKDWLREDRPTNPSQTARDGRLRGPSLPPGWLLETRNGTHLLLHPDRPTWCAVNDFGLIGQIVTLKPNGDAYACALMMKDEDHIGNVRDHGLRELQESHGLK